MNSWLGKAIKVTDDIKGVISYTLPIKLVLGLFVTAVGSASVLGLLSEFAVYNYALVKGFRVPVEGIPYLRPTVTLISLCLFVFAAFGFLLVYYFAKSTAMFISAPEQVVKFLVQKLKISENRVSDLSLTESMRNISNRKALLVSTILALGVVVIITLIVHYTSMSGNSIYAVKGLVEFNFNWQIATFLAAFITYFSVFRPKYIKHMAIVSSLLSAILLICFLFNGNLYSSFLNVIGFGGERDITIISKDKEETLSGKLLIQSNDYYIVLISNSDVVEFPLSKVDRVLYPQSENFWHWVEI